MQAIVSGLNFILAKIVAAIKWIGDLFVDIFKAGWDMLTDLFCWAFESILRLVVTIVGGVDFSGLVSQAGAWAALPPEVTATLSAVGISQAMGIIISACMIRITLQLIPFTRLGS